jgi:hypothetical protein
VSILSAILLVLAVAVVAGAEWPRISAALGASGRSPRPRTRPRSRHLRIVKDVDGAMTPPAPSVSDTDAFVESVRRDLDRLPTFDRDAKRDS